MTDTKNTQLEEIVVSGKGISETTAALNGLATAAAATDEKVRRSSQSWEQLKNRFIEGNAAAAGAEKALVALQNAVTSGKARGEELAAAFAGIQSRFGAVAVGASITKDSLSSLAVKLGDLSVSTEVDRLANAKLAAGLDELRLKYDPVRREITAYGAELTRVKAILEAVNVPEVERVRLMKAVEQALNPAIKAENDYTAALRKQKEARAALMAGYRDEASLARSSAAGQATFGPAPLTAGSARDSASVFQASFDAEDDAKKRAASIEALRNKYVPLAAAQQQYLTDLKAIKTAGNDVFRTEDERAAAITRTKDAFARQVVGMQASKKASEEHTQATKLQNYQLINFGQQIQDIGVSLAGGQNPFMVMVQQVPQMASAVGGVDKIGLAFRSLMTPMVMVGAAAATVGGAIFLIGKHAYDAGEQLKTLTTGMELVGRGSSTAGLLQGTVNTSVEGSSASRKEGVAAASTFSGNLNISTDAMKSALIAARALAEVTGTTMPEAASKLNNALEGGFDALVKFNREHRVLSPLQLEVIRNLQTQGNYTEATTLTLSLMGEGLDRLAKDHLSPFGKTLAAIGDIYNGVADAATRSLRAMTPQEKIDQLREELRVAQEYANRPLISKSLTGSGVRSEDEIRKDIAATKATQEALKELDRQKTEFAKKDDLRTQDSTNKAAVDRAAAVGAVPPARAGIEDIRQREKLAKDDVERLKIVGERLVAEKQFEISQRREIEQLKLQAAAQEQLTAAIGGGILAQQSAEKVNAESVYKFQWGTEGLQRYMRVFERLQDAQLSYTQDKFIEQLVDQAKAADDLSAAWASGNIEAIRKAQLDAQAVQLQKQLGVSIEVATQMAERQIKTQTDPARQTALTTLRQQVELTERLAVLEGTGNTVGARKASLDATMETYGQSNPNASDGDRAAQRALLERQQQAGLKGQAYALQAQMDPVVARKKALAELSDLEQQHILSEEDIARRRMEINIAYEQGEIDKLEATRTFTGGAEAAMRRYAMDVSNWAAQGASLISNSLKSVEDGFVGFARGTKTAGDAMRDFANVVLMEIERMAARALIAQTISPLMNALFSGIGEFAKGIFGDSHQAAVNSQIDSMLADIPAKAEGGLITGPGTGTSDSVPAWVSNGEFVMNAESTKKHIGLLTAMNDNKYASGGMVGSYSPSSSTGASSLGPIINIIDQRTGMDGQAGEGVSARSGGQGPDGRQIIEVLVTDLVNKALTGGKVDKSMSASYGVQRKGIAR